MRTLLAHVKNNNIPNNNRSNSAIWFPVFITGSKWQNVKPSKQAKTSYNKHGKKILSLLVCSDIVTKRHTHQNNGLGFRCWIKHIAFQAYFLIWRNKKCNRGEHMNEQSVLYYICIGYLEHFATVLYFQSAWIHCSLGPNAEFGY